METERSRQQAETDEKPADGARKRRSRDGRRRSGVNHGGAGRERKRDEAEIEAAEGRRDKREERQRSPVAENYTKTDQ